MNKKVESSYWKKRAKDYNKLSWTRKHEFMDAMIRFCRPRKTDIALDLGSGTGAVTQHLADNVGLVMGVDISEDMIMQALTNNNVMCQLMNAEELKLPDNFFDLVTARMVFHHIEKMDRAMGEARRVLKKGGRMVICEGVPPHPSVKKRYMEIFKIKEKRHTFLIEDLVGLFKKAKFKSIKVKEYIMKNVSMQNWLNNSGLQYGACRKIENLHICADENFKKVYNMKITRDDIIMDWKFVFVSGEK
ncbi:MAG: methyltransferase domain-containing protein [Elusimicrobia bacterium]|nr:methyltransferase domain-containing protein [Elusimicrobiota bacterium]